MTTIIWLLMGFAALTSLAVLAQSFRRAVFAWGELQHALSTCPERKNCRITRIELIGRPLGEPLAIRQVSRYVRQRSLQPALRAAA